MANERIKSCDVCGARMATIGAEGTVHGKTWEFGGFVAIVNGRRIEKAGTFETCSRDCLQTACQRLIEQVQADAMPAV